MPVKMQQSAGQGGQRTTQDVLSSGVGGLELVLHRQALHQGRAQLGEGASEGLHILQARLASQLEFFVAGGCPMFRRLVQVQAEPALSELLPR